MFSVLKRNQVCRFWSLETIKITQMERLNVAVLMPPKRPRIEAGGPWPGVFMHTLAMLNIEPPEPKNSGSNADDPINLAHLLGMLHIVDLIVDLKPEWFNN
jgi:hypothetical protein